MFEHIEKTFPKDTKVWIFCADKHLSEDLTAQIKQSLNEYLPTWKSHEMDNESHYELLYSQVIVLTATNAECGASGCSIDSMTNFIKQLGLKHHIDFFNRLLIHVVHENKLQTFTTAEISNAINSGILSSDSKMVNISVDKVMNLTNDFLIPIHKSWARKFIPQQVQN